METLKNAGDVQKQDTGNACWVRLDTGEVVTFQDRYSAIAAIHLNQALPDGVRSYFATIQNLYVYSWFAYNFYALAVFLSFAAYWRFAPVQNPPRCENAATARCSLPGRGQRLKRASPVSRLR